MHGAPLGSTPANFPRAEIHPHAQQAAEAAEAAGAQGKFWEMHDYLFAHQPALGDTDLIHYSGALGLDVERFARELRDHVYAARVRNDVEGGIRSDVSQTPTFFLNGVHQGGVFTVPALMDSLEVLSLSRMMHRVHERAGQPRERTCDIGPRLIDA
jgi:protein-disulfide isomerase